MANQSTQVQAHDDWDTHWDQYAESASQNPAQTMRHELVLEALGRPTERLLDIGSGQADFLTRARSRGMANEYAGFEMSESGVALGRKKFPAAKFVQVNLFSPPPEAAAFEGWATAAVCTDVIEHVDDPVAFLTAARKYLAPGARLVLTVPGGPMSAFDKHIGHRRHYTRELAKKTLEEAGFTVDETRMAGFPFFNLYRLMVIARGQKLIREVESGEMARGQNRTAKLAMRAFDALFRMNTSDSRYGWQVVALARA